MSPSAAHLDPGRLLGRIQQLAGALSSTDDLDDVLTVATEGMASTFGAISGIGVVIDHVTDRCVIRTAYGLDGDTTVKRWAEFSLHDPLPLSEAARSGTLLVVGSVEERDRRWPDLAGTTDPGHEAWAAVPVFVGERVAAMIALVFGEPRHFESDETAFMGALAAIVGQAIERIEAIERQRIEHAAVELLNEAGTRFVGVLDEREAAGLLAELGSALGEWAAVFLADPDERLERVAVVHRLGPHPDADDLLAEPYRTGPLARRAAATGEPVLIADLWSDAGLELMAPDEDDMLDRFRRLGWGSALAVPLIARGRLVGVLAVARTEAAALDGVDLALATELARRAALAVDNARLLAAEATERRRAEDARERLTFLSDVSSTIAGSLDRPTLLAHLCRLVVPRLGDWATILLPDGGVSLERVAAAHADPSRAEVVDELVHRFPVPITASNPISTAFRTGRPVLVEDVNADVAASVSDEAEYQEVLARLGTRSGLFVPLVARGHVVGVMNLARAEGHDYTDDDLWLAVEVARRAAVGIDNVSLFEQEHQVAELLQQAVLPEQLPEHVGIDLAARYLPAGPGVEVGGDWYDAFALDDGSLALVVGDVAGHDVEAAAVMAQLRNGLRAYALEGAEPAEVMGQVNRLLCRSREPRFTTALYLVVAADHRRVRWVNAGHPPPVRVVAGVGEALAEPRGLVLGVAADATYVEGEAELRVGDAFVLYTDGLVERRGENLTLGLDRAVDVSVAAWTEAASADALSDHLLRRLLVAGRPRTDDVCVMVAWRSEIAAEPESWQLPVRDTSPGHARREVAAVLGRWGLEALRDPAALLVSELVTNAVVHAGTPVRLRMEPIARGVRIRVHDDAGQREIELREPPSVDSPTGRGLLVVSRVADRWGVEASGLGKEVWFELTEAGVADRWS